MEESEGQPLGREQQLSGEQRLRQLYEQLGGERGEFPHDYKPEFQQGAADYVALKEHGKVADGKTGELYVKGLRVLGGYVYMTVPASTPEDYVNKVGNFLARANNLVNMPGSEWVFGTNTLLMGSQELEEKIKQKAAYTAPEARPQVDSGKELAAIKIQMTGFGKAALGAGDIRVALLAFETGSALGNLRVVEAIEKIVSEGDKRIKDDFIRAMREIYGKR